MAAAATTRWYLKGRGYEFCNCYFGCGCNFGGFPNSKDGSCRALVGIAITEGKCGDIDLSGVKCAGVYAWPKAIHEGNGRSVFVADAATNDKQTDALRQIFAGKLGGMPWEILGPTAETLGVVKAKITIEGSGRKSTFRAEGVGEGRGDTLKNPVTGEDHLVDVVLDQGFIWKKGECGTGSFQASALGLSVAAEKTNWIHYQFEWANS
jgi:hypothetical protein